MAGYSGTPLAKKLGYKSDFTVYLHAAPDNYHTLLALDEAVSITWARRPGKQVNLIHAFANRFAELSRLLASYRQQLAPDGAVWISWPKKASKVPTDITENRIREAALPLGFVDIKVCAVDEVWSGLKLVVRKELR
jgi:ethanolamine utilization microcompartment shell protein EutS